MLDVILISQLSPDYITQIIGIIGTILGAVSGALLQTYIERRGKLYIYVDAFQEKKSKSNEYAYIAKVYINNTSYRQKCMRNLRFSFVTKEGITVINSIPKKGIADFDCVKMKNENKIEMLNVNSYSQNEYKLAGVIEGEEFEKLLNVRKIYLIYKNEKNHMKKILVKRNLDLENVSVYHMNGFM